MSESRLRIGKALARLGLCSRREAVKYLEHNIVEYEGELITRPDFTIPDSIEALQRIVVSGKNNLAPDISRVLLFYKPVNVLSTHRKSGKYQENMKTIFDLLPEKYARWFFAGRLDFKSEGLMVLTADGDHIFQLSHPSGECLKRYEIQTHRPLSGTEMQRMEKGIFSQGEKIAFHKIVSMPKPAHYMVELYEGKNREIRRVLEKFNIRAVCLKRIQLGPYQLGSLAPGDFTELDKVSLPPISHNRNERNNINHD